MTKEILGLSTEDVLFLRKLAQELKTQDTRGTAKPYGLVIGQKKRQITDFEYSSKTAVHWNECDYDSFEELMDAMKEYYLEDEESHEVIDYIEENCSSMSDLKNHEYKIRELVNDTFSVYGYEVVDDFTPTRDSGNFFLTEKAAKAYLEANSHNLNRGFTYGIHLFRNPEMETLLNIVEKIGTNLEEVSNA